MRDGQKKSIGSDTSVPLVQSAFSLIRTMHVSTALMPQIWLLAIIEFLPLGADLFFGFLVDELGFCYLTPTRMR